MFEAQREKTKDQHTKTQRETITRRDYYDILLI